MLYDSKKSKQNRSCRKKNTENAWQIIAYMISLLQKGVSDMLKKFQVENYRGFKGSLSWDLSDTRDYGFRKNLVDNKIAKKSVVSIQQWA